MNRRSTRRDFLQSAALAGVGYWVAGGVRADEKPMSANDTIRFAGSGNVINAGAGSNVLMESGGNNTIVLPAANKGIDDIFGYVMTNVDKFDLRGSGLTYADLTIVNQEFQTSITSTKGTISIFESFDQPVGITSADFIFA